MADITITRTMVVPEEDSVTMLVRDRFDIPSNSGRRQVLYSPYHPRVINDVEGVISEDNGALRIRPKTTPGWGRSSLVYGPFARQSGLTFATIILNGHNGSQSDGLMQPYSSRMRQWLRGSGSFRGRRRALQWLSNGQHGRTIKQFRRWKKMDRQKRSGKLPQLDENLAVGWFGEKDGNPLESASAMVMRSAGATNGMLCTLSSAKLVEVAPEMMNVPMCLVTILRPNGAAYYAASIAGVHTLGEFPKLRPLAIDTAGRSKSVYAGIDQSVLGQVGFEASTRVYDARVAHVGAWGSWYGAAHIADSMKGRGTLESNSAETDQQWAVRGSLWRTPGGVIGERDNFAMLKHDTANGLLHAQIDSSKPSARIALYWRLDERGDGFRVIVSPKGSVVQAAIQGSWINLGDIRSGLRKGVTQCLQIRDDGLNIAIDLDGETLFELEDGYNANEGNIGFALTEGAMLHHLEGHPRELSLPARFDMRMPYLPKPGMMAVWDELTGAGEPLHRSKTMTGRREWQRVFGEGELQRDLRGAEVIASKNSPNPGRTLYALDWHDVAFASIAVDILPPGSQRGDGERGRGGLVFWQDDDNYIIINSWLDDSYAGGSISAFFHLNGFEELYDTVWVNIGRKIEWGKPYNLRVDFDGAVFVVYLNNEPVLYRALRDIYPKQEPLLLNKVGVAVNWEWGDDTGSIFENFVGRGADRVVEQTRVGFRAE